MKLIISLILYFLFLSGNGYSQIDRGFELAFPQHIVKEDSNETIYKIGQNLNHSGVFRGTHYCIYDEDGKIIEQGRFVIKGRDQFTRDSFCKEYYPSGQIRNKGFYFNGLPIGEWKSYYSNGKMQVRCSYAFISGEQSIQTGPYQEFYADGKIAITGTFSIGIDTLHEFDTLMVMDSFGNITPIVTKGPTKNVTRHLKEGLWKQYSENGEIRSWREYHKGDLIFEIEYIYNENGEVIDKKEHIY